MECYFVIGSSGTANHSAHRTCDKSLRLHTMCRMRTQQNTTKPNDKIFDSNERTNEWKKNNDLTTKRQQRRGKKKKKTDVILFVVSHCLISFLFGHAQWQRTNGDTTNDRTNKQKKREMGKKRGWDTTNNSKKDTWKKRKHLYLSFGDLWFVVSLCHLNRRAHVCAHRSLSRHFGWNTF